MLDEYLLEWIILHVKNKDILTRSLLTLEKKDRAVLCIYKTKKKLIVVEPFVDSYAQLLCRADSLCSTEPMEIGLVVFNTKANVDKLIAEWKALIMHTQLSMCFVNPVAEHQKLWCIWPKTHHSITDPESLELGLQSLADGVGMITEEELKRKCT